MINVKKIINSSPKESKNILHDICIPVNKRSGFVRGKCPIIPSYFYRYIGVKEDEKEYYDELYKLDQRLSDFRNLYVKFISRIPLDSSIDILNKTESIWKSISSFDDSQVHNLINSFKKAEIFPKLNLELLNSSLEESFSYVIKLYLKNSKNVNKTQIKNFCYKLLQWINEFVPNLVKGLDFMDSMGNEIHNPKVVYYGNIKNHEVYFLIFLSKFGCDILYLNTFSDEEFTKVNGNNSKVFTLPKRAEFKAFPDFCKQQKTVEHCSKSNSNNYQNTKNKINREVNLAVNNPKDVESKVENKRQLEKILNSPLGIIASLKKSKNILEDIKRPLNSRVGFHSGTNPIIPVCFCRYIGIKENEDMYYNDLFRLDKYLSSLEQLYLKFTNSIPLGTSVELAKKSQHIWRNITSFETSQKDFLMNDLIEAGVFPKLDNKTLQFSVIRAFNEILEMFLNNETNVNGAKIKNFSLKLLIWLNEYIFKLFEKFDYERNKEQDIYNPKIMYYGDIKKHEAYFLLLLSKLGCDVIYINSNSDSVFSNIDQTLEYSQVFELPKKLQLKEFPKEEIYIRQETTAYKASEEISKMLFSDEVGMYKPWQFEKYNIKPLTLKTTFDELKILWNESSSVRTGFKVENGVVYIPNLFAKISGVHENLNVYCEEFQTFKSSENTICKFNIPFTKRDYSKNDLYTLMTVFNREGKVDKEKLMSNRFYKYSYLKTSVQDTIIEKINCLLKMEMLKKSSSKEIILVIVMTILNLDKEILELIQTFDYPNKIPKLIIFDNDENVFSEEDSIVLAFLNLMCFDILIFTPTGYNNIEQRIMEKYYDIHKLEKIKLDFEISMLENSKGKINSLWKGLFGKVK